MQEQPEDAPLRLIYRNPPRRERDICPICTAPKNPNYPLCHACNMHSGSGEPLADFVAPLSWAPIGGQAYADLSSYKDEAQQEVADVAAERLRLMLRLAFTNYAQCLMPGWEASTVAIVNVPSTAGRLGPHPMEAILAMFGPNIPRLMPVYVGDTDRTRDGRRQLRPDDWKVNPSALAGLTQAVVIDDSWVTGGHAQSIASSLKLAGIARVGIVPFGRVLRTDWAPNIEYFHDHPAIAFDSQVCPLHGTRHT